MMRQLNHLIGAINMTLGTIGFLQRETKNATRINNGNGNGRPIRIQISRLLDKNGNVIYSDVQEIPLDTASVMITAAEKAPYFGKPPRIVGNLFDWSQNPDIETSLGNVESNIVNSTSHNTIEILGNAKALQCMKQIAARKYLFAEQELKSYIEDEARQPSRSFNCGVMGFGKVINGVPITPEGLQRFREREQERKREHAVEKQPQHPNVAPPRSKVTVVSAGAHVDSLILEQRSHFVECNGVIPAGDRARLSIFQQMFDGDRQGQSKSEVTMIEDGAGVGSIIYITDSAESHDEAGNKVKTTTL